EDARAARPDAIIATGRSDYANQINNVLGFPYIFRGALDVRGDSGYVIVGNGITGTSATQNQPPLNARLSPALRSRSLNRNRQAGVSPSGASQLVNRPSLKR